MIFRVNSVYWRQEVFVMMIICIAVISLGLTTIDQVDENIHQFVKCVQFSVLLKFDLICINIT